MRKLTFLLLVCLAPSVQAEPPQAIQDALERAGENRAEIEQALDQVPARQRKGMQFLVEHMPTQDLASLKAEYLLTNVRFAYQAWQSSPWKADVPEGIFLNNVLPYSVINERRDDWRKDFYQRFAPLVKDAKSPAEAAVILNQNVFKIVNVKYSTKRKKPDQSPYESMETGLASCSGLTVLLVDACRSVGVPARFVGTPLWTNKSGNHSWAEVWDQRWHFTGACEATGNDLDKGWFVGRAATAKRDDMLHAIYAVSYKQTPQFFPMVWSQQDRTVPAVNVTDYYTRLGKPLPEGFVLASVKVVDGRTGQRLAADLKISDENGELVFAGQSNDERFDANNHVQLQARVGSRLQVGYSLNGSSKTHTWQIKKPDQLLTLKIGK